jgi:hypothetical protein
VKKVHKVRKVHKANEALRVLKVVRAQLEKMALKDLPVRKVLKAIPVKMDNQVHKVH